MQGENKYRFLTLPLAAGLLRSCSVDGGAILPVEGSSTNPALLLPGCQKNASVLMMIKQLCEYAGTVLQRAGGGEHIQIGTKGACFEIDGCSPV
jgi:hypothetical protein